MTTSDETDTFGRDPFIWLSAVALPIANTGLWAAIRFTGGAHAPGPLIAVSAVGAESIFITWFCAKKTKRSTSRWAARGAILNVMLSAVAIMVVTLVVLVLGYAGGRPGE